MDELVPGAVEIVVRVESTTGYYDSNLDGKATKDTGRKISSMTRAKFFPGKNQK